MTRTHFFASTVSLGIMASIACRDASVEPTAQATSDARQPATWRATVLPGLGGCCSFAGAINDHGQIVGWSTVAEETHAVLWDHGQVIDLGRPGEMSTAGGINERGQVIGTHWAAGEIGRAFLWENGVRTELGTLGGDWSLATGLNQRGQVVGYSPRASSAEPHAFFWEHGVMTDLDTTGDLFSQPMDINDRGQVLVMGQTHGFIWQNGERTELDSMGGRAINNRGQVVGNLVSTQELVIWERGTVTSIPLGDKSASPGNIDDRGAVIGVIYPTIDPSLEHAFLWQDGALTDLGTLGGVLSNAGAMNRRGQVVGFSTTEGWLYHPFVWESGIMTDLGVLPGDEEATANSINSFGQIVGVSYRQTSRHMVAVLWTR